MRQIFLSSLFLEFLINLFNMKVATSTMAYLILNLALFSKFWFLFFGNFSEKSNNVVSQMIVSVKPPFSFGPPLKLT